MCSSGGQVAADDQALQNANLAANTALTQDYTSSIGKQNQILGNLTAKMNYMAANPMGYTPTELHNATTSINENTANAAKQAIGAASAFAARHGGADVGGGGTGAVVGQIGSQAAQEKAGELSSLSQQNEALKQENMWKAISGLGSAGAEYGGAAGTQISGAEGASNAGVGAGSGVLAAKQAGWKNLVGC